MRITENQKMGVVHYFTLLLYPTLAHHLTTRTPGPSAGLHVHGLDLRDWGSNQSARDQTDSPASVWLSASSRVHPGLTFAAAAGTDRTSEWRQGTG